MKTWLNRTICRLIGHRWGWPDIPIVAGPNGIGIFCLWRTCERCGARQSDDKSEATVIFGASYQGDPRDCAFRQQSASGFDELGKRVKRAMGWDK